MTKQDKIAWMIYNFLYDEDIQTLKLDLEFTELLDDKINDLSKKIIKVVEE